MLRPAADLPAALLAWYDQHRRALPWRARPGEVADPYRVWLSEIMLQQTTVAAVGPYYRRFLARWPDIHALARAELDAVLHAWQGLGYYARARNLHACARDVARRDGFPDTEAGLRALPGIGVYTAAAIAAIAFGRPAAAVDGNAERVLTRLYGVHTPLPAAKKRLRAHAAALVPADRPGDFAQALMDLGATICTPKQPRCGLC
ncbi:MAG: A/G-specific adenine glycosylase, partial [Stellaceae bacterium]